MDETRREAWKLELAHMRQRVPTANVSRGSTRRRSPPPRDTHEARKDRMKYYGTVPDLAPDFWPMMGISQKLRLDREAVVRNRVRWSERWDAAFPFQYTEDA